MRCFSSRILLLYPSAGLNLSGSLSTKSILIVTGLVAERGLLSRVSINTNPLPFCVPRVTVGIFPVNHFCPNLIDSRGKRDARSEN
jgi:hypothetical protein